jgi:hypothetical protein
VFRTFGSWSYAVGPARSEGPDSCALPMAQPVHTPAICRLANTRFSPSLSCARFLLRVAVEDFMKSLVRVGCLVAAVGLWGCPAPEPTEPEFPPPPEGEGTQFGTGLQAVGPGEEVQNCFFFKVKDLLKASGLEGAESFNLHRVQIDQKEGSHHMNIFRVRTITPHEQGGLDPAKGPYLGLNGTGACFKSSNWSDWPLVANTQVDGTLDWEFPEGVANKLEADEWLMLQSHYVNATTQKSPEDGDVKVNFWHLPDAKVVHEMGTIFATKQSIRICQGLPQPEYSGGCQIKGDEPATIIGANGHFHSRGKEFRMYEWDGVSSTKPADDALFYQSNDWEEPKMAMDNQLATIQPGGGVFYTCDFQWTEPPAPLSCEDLNAFDQTKYKTPEDELDCCYTFGPVVDRNEHCNGFIYYYPKTSDVFCN